MKGCRNPDLKTAMKTQLIDRYLKDNFYDHGIYLAGWFMCNKWMNQDRRKRQLSFKGLAEAHRFFKKQAHSLSGEQKFVKYDLGIERCIGLTFISLSRVGFDSFAGIWESSTRVPRRILWAPASTSPIQPKCSTKVHTELME